MSDRMDFEIVSPNDREQTLRSAGKNFEAELKSGALVFHCNTCDANWQPSHKDIAKIRRELLGGTIIDAGETQTTSVTKPCAYDPPIKQILWLRALYSGPE